MDNTDLSDTPAPHYVEPSPQCIARFARTACRTLAQTLDKQYADPDIIRGLAEFLQILAEMGTEALNHRSAAPLPTTDH